LLRASAVLTVLVVAARLVVLAALIIVLTGLAPLRVLLFLLTAALAGVLALLVLALAVLLFLLAGVLIGLVAALLVVLSHDALLFQTAWGIGMKKTLLPANCSARLKRLGANFGRNSGGSARASD
jgi:hypothetical protein